MAALGFIPPAVTRAFADDAIFSTCGKYSLVEGELVGEYLGEFPTGPYGRQDIGLVVYEVTGNTAKVLWAWANGTKEYAGRDGCHRGEASVTTSTMTGNPTLVIKFPKSWGGKWAEITFSPSTERVSVGFHNAQGGLSQGYVLPTEK